MTFISVTRLRIRSAFFLPPFFWGNERAARQLARSPGYLGGKLLIDRHRTFWTVTAWDDEAGMRAFRSSGAHRQVMPRLLSWCDEASIAHWTQDGPELPDWLEAHRRLTADGRLSKVRHPSPQHSARQIALPRVPSRLERFLPPASGRDKNDGASGGTR
jgi:hypothetical protein